MASKKATSEAEALSTIGPLAKVVGKGVGELWKIFVMRYVARGVAELVAAAGLWYFGEPWHLTSNPGQWWRWIIVALSGVLIFDAIQLLINPRYFAMNDVIDIVNKERSSGSDITVYQKN